jgi:hypothetical protein
MIPISAGVVGSGHVLDVSDIYGESQSTRDIVTDSISSAMQHNVLCLIRWLLNTGKDGDIT